jgi:hypothetical protein
MKNPVDINNLKRYEVFVMSKRLLIVSAFLMALPFNLVMADEQIYGSQLMTQQEREEHRAKMQSMKTEAERDRYRMEHHKKMQERAKERGVTLPDKPQYQGTGKQGKGQGKEKGKGLQNSQGKCGGQGKGGGKR